MNGRTEREQIPGTDVEGVPGVEADVERDSRPPRSTVATSLVAATIATVATLVSSPPGGAIVGLTLVGFGAGTVAGSSRVLSWGVGAGVVGIAVAAGTGGSPEPLLVAAVALAVGWDVADHGLSIGRHVGRDARARRNVVVHTTTSLLVGTLSATAVYGSYVAAAGGQPIAALALLLFGGVVLVSAFR